MPSVWESTLESAQRDIAYGLRTMKRSPVFAAVVILSLGLGIGANTAILTVLNAAVWAPLPVAAPERLVQIRTVEDTGKERGLPFGLLEHLQGDRRVFAGAAVSGRDGVALRSAGRRSARSRRR